MKNEIELTIENRLVTEKRAINIYHHATRGAHMISHGSSVGFSLKTAKEDDYLHISLVSGSGDLKNMNVVNLPLWADFEFYCDRTVAVSHSGDRILVTIPPGTPPWQLRITWLANSPPKRWAEHVTIRDHSEMNR